MKYKSIHLIIALFVFQCFLNTAVHAMIPKEIEEKYTSIAKGKILKNPKSYEELEALFKGVLLEGPQVHFKRYFTLMFDPKFPPQKHSEERVLEGWQCLFGKMTYALTLGEKAKEFQMAGINGVLSMHRDELAKFDETATLEIPDKKKYACLKCKDKDVFGRVYEDTCLNKIDETSKATSN